MRAAHNSGRPSGGNGAAFLPRAVLVHVVEVMHITGKGRTWQQEGSDWLSSSRANSEADKVRKQGFVVRTRPLVRYQHTGQGLTLDLPPCGSTWGLRA